MAGFEHILLAQDDNHVATLVLNRPHVLNALSSAMVDEIRAAVESLEGSGARCLLIAGEGRGFSSGADLAAAAGAGDVGAMLEKHLNPMMKALFDLPIPVIAAVNGPAAGAGCSLALAADLVIAGRSAYFLQAFVNIGLVPDAGATWLLPRLAGRARAMEMMMLGERLPAPLALEWGLIARVVDDERLGAEAAALATRLAQGPTVALGLIRKLAREAEHMPLDTALAGERAAQREAGDTADFKAAVAAFLDKRPARFEGH